MNRSLSDVVRAVRRPATEGYVLVGAAVLAAVNVGVVLTLPAPLWGGELAYAVAVGGYTTLVVIQSAVYLLY